MRTALLLVAALGLAACGKAPSTEQCRQLLDHLISIEATAGGGGSGEDAARQKSQLADFASPKFMETCSKKTPKSVVECALAAKTVDDVGKCDEK